MASCAAQEPRAPRLVVTVCDAAGRPVRVPGLAAWLAGIAPLAKAGAATVTVTVVVTTDRRIRRLNRTWRGIDKATDVLSFPAGDDPGPARHLGDLVISRETAARQARHEGHSLATELRVLALHGLLASPRL